MKFNSQNMTKEYFKFLFSWQGRMNAREYSNIWISLILLTIAIAVAGQIVQTNIYIISDLARIVGLGMAICALCNIYAIFPSMAKRIRDTGKNAWPRMLFFMVLFGYFYPIYLAFAKSAESVCEEVEPKT